MQKRHIVYNIQGMGLDVVSSPLNTNMAYSIKNMRLTPTKDSNALELTTERGTLIINVDGDDFPSNATVIGYCTLLEYLVLFIKADKLYNTQTPPVWNGGPDYIYRLKQVDTNSDGVIDSYESVKLFEGDLNFDINSNIEATSYFENSNVQKVYWVDGVNQPRMINILLTPHSSFSGVYAGFDFLLSVLQRSSSARIVAKKIYTGGNFTAGVIQYAYSLYSINSQETPLLDVTSLHYITNYDRGGSPNEQCSCAFEINILNNNLLNNFDYIRVYSIQRNSLNGTPLARVVADIPFDTNVTIIDDGNGGYDIDYNQLQYQRLPIYPLTLTLKENVLFMGNYTIETTSEDMTHLYEFDIDDPTDPNYIQIDTENWWPYTSQYDLHYGVLVYDPNDISVYPWKNQLNTESAGVKTFKYLETYKLGVQFQDKYGNWSQPYFIRDIQQDKYPIINNGLLLKPIFTCKIMDIFNKLYSWEKDLYVRVRPIISYPAFTERSLLCQGVLNPTVFNLTQRIEKTNYSLSSWFFRPFVKSFSGTNTTYNSLNNGATNEFRHFEGLCNSGDIGGEILGIYYDNSAIDPSIYYSSYTSTTDSCLRPKTNILGLVNSNESDHYKNFYFIDTSVLTFNSPDVEFNLFFNDIENTYSVNISGYISVENNIGNFNITSYSPCTFLDKNAGLPDGNIRGPLLASGFHNYRVLNILQNSDSYGGLSSVNGWFDDIPLINYAQLFDMISIILNGSVALDYYWNPDHLELAYTIYPWQRLYLNSYDVLYCDESEAETSKIVLKVLSNFKLSNLTNYLSSLHNLPTSDIVLCSSDSIINKFNDNKVYYPNFNEYLNYNTEYYGIMKTSTYQSSGTATYTRIGYPIMFDTAFNIVDTYQTSLPINDKFLQKVSDYNSFISKSISIPLEAFRNNYKLLLDFNTSSGTSTFNLSLDHIQGLVTTRSPYMSDDPILLSYKSNKHCILQLDSKKFLNDKIYKCSLPLLGSSSSVNNVFFSLLQDKYLPWYDVNDITYDYDLTGYYRDVIGINDFSNVNNYLFIADISKPISASYLNKWTPGSVIGTGTLSNQSNLYIRNWTPCGKAQLIPLDPSSTVKLSWIEGDTYYQRYDCVKTKPYSEDDYQSVIEILSFMVESNINLDGRYDKNRGILDYTIISDDNFNLFNDVYNQENNFFTYQILDPTKFNVDEFRNDIVWSTKKISGESIDQWTKLSSINQLQLDGNKGHVKALRKFNDNIYCFQDHATSRIRFNDRTAIATESGEPLQLAHTNYVDGYEYVNGDIGCQYGISCCETENGIFFIDNDIPGIYKLSYNEYGNVNIKNITKEKLMQRWFENIGNVNKTRVFFDKPVNEILTLNNKTLQSEENGYCLSFSCDMNTFQQFIDYEKAQYILTHNNWPVAVTNINGDIELWKLRNGSFVSFFGQYRRPYGLKFIASPPRTNEGLIVDCIYDNLSYKADVFVGPNGDDANLGSYSYQPNESFDSINVYSIYQSLDNDESLSYTNQPHHSISNLRKKFGVWFARIPRFSDISQPQGRYNKERMRGSKLMIDLMKNQPGVTNSKLVLKELSVDCFY